MSHKGFIDMLTANGKTVKLNATIQNYRKIGGNNEQGQ